ncbi:MAG: globin family protein [Burkholderiales bacterium]
MTPQQIGLVQATWQQVLPIRETAAELFYSRLFAQDPALKSLFKGDLKEQGKKLMSMIGTAVISLNELNTIVPAVQALGRRHAGYGVRPHDYSTVGAALLWTLEQELGTACTAEVKQAWTDVYGVLATTMRQAAEAG